MTVSNPANYPPRTSPDKFVVRAHDRAGNIMRFPSITAQPDFASAKKIALRVAKRPDTFNVNVLRIPGER